MLLAHLSDLHLGKSPRHAATSLALREAVINHGVDHTIITGDITEHGKASEYDTFKKIFSNLLESGRVTVVPGNHDRLGDEVAKDMMEGQVVLTVRSGLHLISVDSTGSHNRWRHASHGKISAQLIARITELVEQALPSDFVAVALHHHLLPLPEDLWVEKISGLLRLPFASELKLGRKLLERLQNKCDVVLHGHRHQAMEKTLPGVRDLRLYNAGSSTMLKGFRLFDIENGRLLTPPVWISINA